MKKTPIYISVGREYTVFSDKSLINNITKDWLWDGKNTFLSEATLAEIKAGDWSGMKWIKCKPITLENK